MHAVGSTPWVLDLACTHATALGMNTTAARVLHHYNNAVVLLPAENTVIRLASTEAVDRIAASQDVCRWLSSQHEYPATIPAPGATVALLADSMTASLWTYHPPPRSPLTTTSADLAKLLHTLHSLPVPPAALRPWEPLSSLHAILAGPDAHAVMTGPEIEAVQAILADIHDRLATHDWPLGHGLIHGDAWQGNLLHDNSSSTPQLRLGDWDNVAIGPREVDLIPTWHASYRYGKGQHWRDEFQRAYGYDLQESPRFADLMAMRDLAQLGGPIRRAAHNPRYAAALRQRLGDILGGQHHTTWTALTGSA
ncbi:aminoglycoside phosphotransferase [Rhizocola hellebori]|uniref:Aminoglycoside phosphotransferase n=1 Tax=Rhizocola hellebori TaxID=1392758 RepID=A0A8J3Q556_9ACTN|nr:phosphotransferase [Rhizocola hellebori]GIH03410.1 aminoglycoside phosphotransferase [Rhizocola hellebori]